MKLDKSIVQATKEAEIVLNKNVNQISGRITEILNIVAKCFGTKLEWWDYSNGGGETDGHFKSDMISDDELQLDGRFKNSLDMVAILKDNSEWGFDYVSIPTRFLFEDFEEELKNGIKKCKQVEIDRKKLEAKKREDKNLERRKLIENVKKKLTKEEKKALGI